MTRGESTLTQPSACKSTDIVSRQQALRRKKDFYAIWKLQIRDGFKIYGKSPREKQTLY
jgi:hypothetical protein